MSHAETYLTRFDRFAGEILDGSLPYGLSPRRPRSRWRFAVVLTHEREPGATIIVMAASAGVQAAITFRHVQVLSAQSVMEDFQRFMHRMKAEEDFPGGVGKLPLRFLTRVEGIERLRSLAYAH